MTDLDQFDKKILAILQQDGRITNIDLAERVRLSATATAERVKRLTKEQYILGYSASLSPSKLGLSLLVFVEIKLDRISPQLFDDFARAIERAPQILECHMVAGGFDYLIKARVRNMGEYRLFLSDVILALPGIRETHTYAVMEEVKSSSTFAV